MPSGREKSTCSNPSTTVKTTATTLDADETDILIELFGTHAAPLAKFYKTPARAMDYFYYSVLPTSQPEADTPAEPSAPII